jgi:hypothetical protein
MAKFFILVLTTLLAVTSFPRSAKAASFVVERSQMRVRGEGFAASFLSAIGDVRKHLSFLFFYQTIKTD